jgi:hypothetical protein
MCTGRSETYPAEVGGGDAGEVEPAGGHGGAGEEDGDEEEEGSRVRRHGGFASDSEQAREAREKREGRDKKGGVSVSEVVSPAADAASWRRLGFDGCPSDPRGVR